MSKERELLKKAFDALDDMLREPELCREIYEILAQPETEQEPVAWMYDLDIMIHPISYTRSQKFGELTSINPTDRQQDAVNIRPLYTSPPRRKPLSDDEIQDALIKCRQDETWDYGFEVGVKWAEARHGIGAEL